MWEWFLFCFKWTEAFVSFKLNTDLIHIKGKAHGQDNCSYLSDYECGWFLSDEA
jgi:hypothetical protein